MLIAEINLLYNFAHFKIDLMNIDISLRKCVFAALLDDHQKPYQSIEVLILEKFASTSIAVVVCYRLDIREDSVLI